jgi:hypothetical protein
MIQKMQMVNSQQMNLLILVKNRRTWSVYGFSPVERALPLADIYLRRQDWIRKEYTDGVTPELMMETDANFGNNPDLIRAYENIYNDDLAGQTAQRMRVRILPAGFKPIQFDGYGEKFKDTLDNYLITSICGHFGVLPSEIGFQWVRFIRRKRITSWRNHVRRSNRYCSPCSMG